MLLFLAVCLIPPSVRVVPDRSVLESDNSVVLLGIISGNLVELSRAKYIANQRRGSREGDVLVDSRYRSRRETLR
jgi:hypothetical protein